jgi:hypothetical protein
MLSKPTTSIKTPIEKATHRIKEIDETLQRYGEDLRVIRPERKKNLVAERDELLQRIKAGEFK